MAAGARLALSVLCLYGAVATAEVGASGSFKAPSFCGKYQCPQYKVVKDYGGFEHRFYEKAHWISVSINNDKMGTWMISGFRQLLRYINGRNARKMTIEMTVPVLMYVPVTSPSFNATMSLYLPNTLTNPPKPLDPDIFLENSKVESIYVKSFGGVPLDYKFTKQGKILTDELQALGLPFDNSFYMRASYKPPLSMLNNHNEIWYFAKSN